MTNPYPIFLGGPTATGKSEIALLLAERLGGEIISVDSMQVYQGMDIGTAKPSAADRARVRHHLLDLVPVREPFDAAQFVTHAGRAHLEILGRGRFPIFCGGTGFYFKAYLEGIGAGPPADAPLRAMLENTPVAELLRELQRKDPTLFAKIDRNNRRRVVRAIEVIRLTGRPFSEFRISWNKGESARHPGAFIVLDRPLEDLRQRIDRRVDGMFAKGLVRETARLLAEGLGQNRTAMQSLGYHQVAEHLRGERTLDQTVEVVKIRTHQFAKRQRAWFRTQFSAHWIEMGREESAQAVVSKVEQATRSLGWK